MTSRSTSARFVGRGRELARLATALESAANGRASVVSVTASGGMGVSRLLDDVAARLDGLPEPMTVIRGAGTRARRGFPFGPLIDGLAPLLADLPEADLASLTGPAAEELAKLLPDLSPRLEAAGLLPDRPAFVSVERASTTRPGAWGVGVPYRVVNTKPWGSPAHMLEVVLGLLARLGERRPVVLVLEDLHLADAGTRAVATFLARIARHQRLLVIITHQPDELTRSHPLSADLAEMAASARPPDRLDLGPLDRDALADLIEGIEGERPSASVLLLVAERSGGSPLIAEELVAARRELSSASLTGSLEELVMARLALRSAECRRVLRLLAPAGGPLTVGQLAEVAATFETGARALPPRSTSAPRRAGRVLDADLAAGLAEAVECGVLVLASHGQGEVTASSVGDRPDAIVRFRHELIGRAVALDILPTHRRHHHVALASALSGQADVAARHWLAAHANERAAEAATRAAERAELVDAPEDALVHLELALELGPAEADPALLMRAAEAAFAAGRNARAAAFAESAVIRLDERRDRLEVGRIYERLGRYRRAAGDHEGALSALRRAVEVVPMGASLDRARVLAALAQVQMLDGTFSEAVLRAREAVEASRGVAPSTIEETHALTTLGVVQGWSDDPKSGVGVLREARGRAQTLGDRDGYFRATANLTTVLDLLGRREEAVEIAYEGIEEARRVGQEAVYGNFLRGNAADSLFLLGRWDEARVLSEAALEWSEGAASQIFTLVNLATVEIESRAGERAGSLLGQALLDVETVREAQYSVPAYRAAASFALWRGDLADARRAAGRGWARVRETEDWSLIAKMAATVLDVDAAVALDARERRDLATIADVRSEASDVLEAARSAVRSAGVPETLGSRREAEAMLATAAAFGARMEGHEDPATWSAVAGRWSAIGSRYQVARARWREAEAILSAGNEARAARAAARGPLIEAALLAAALGAGPLLRELRALAARALITLPPDVESAWVAVGPGAGGARPADGASAPEAARGEAPAEREVPSSSLLQRFVGEPVPKRGDTFGLSSREREVLELIAQGRTNREIGERLFISQKTVGVHVGNILAKLGVSGRVEAATVAIRLDLTGRRPH